MSSPKITASVTTVFVTSPLPFGSAIVSFARIWFAPHHTIYGDAIGLSDMLKEPKRRSSPSAANLLSPFAVYAPLARSDYYRDSATARCRQPTTNLPSTRLAAGREGRHPAASHVHHHPIVE